MADHAWIPIRCRIRLELFPDTAVLVSRICAADCAVPWRWRSIPDLVRLPIVSYGIGTNRLPLWVWPDSVAGNVCAVLGITIWWTLQFQSRLKKILHRRRQRLLRAKTQGKRRIVPFLH